MTLDRKTMIGVASAERARLGRTIQYAPPDVWESESACAGWRNRDIVAHLAAQDTAAAQLAAGAAPEELERFREANGGELWVSGFNEWAVRIREDLSTRQIIADWGRAADAFLTRVGKLDDQEWHTTKVPWVAGDIGVRFLVQSRVIEWWFHGEDLREGAGLEENPQHWPVHLANDMGIRMLPYALAQVDLSFPGTTLRVDLEGVGGGSWHWGLAPRGSPAEDEKPDAFIEGRATAFALVAGRRHSADGFLDDGNLVIGGDEEVALAVLRHIRAFVE